MYVLGDVQFAEDGDGSKITTQSELDTAASLLGVSSSKLAQALCTSVGTSPEKEVSETSSPRKTRLKKLVP